MKTLKLIGISFIVMLLLFACEKQNDDILFEEALLKTNLESRYGKTNGTLELPFKANFFTKRDYSIEDEGPSYCTQDPYLGFNYQVGEGEATHLGRFSVTIKFCGAGFDYTNGDGVLVAANGDELYIGLIEIGHILPYEHPLYELQFQDPFIFTGGTGRFEGASGGGMTDSFVDLFDDEGNFLPEHQTDHYWSGTLILPKGSN